MKKWKTFGLLALSAGWSQVALADLVFQLTTATYSAFVISRCESGVLACSDVEYLGVDKKTGESTRLKGQSILSGDAPNWVGYEFADGDLKYEIYISGDKADLRILRDGKEVSNELGAFVGL